MFGVIQFPCKMLVFKHVCVCWSCNESMNLRELTMLRVHMANRKFYVDACWQSTVKRKLLCEKFEQKQRFTYVIIIQQLQSAPAVVGLLFTRFTRIIICAHMRMIELFNREEFCLSHKKYRSSNDGVSLLSMWQRSRYVLNESAKTSVRSQYIHFFCMVFVRSYVADVCRRKPCFRRTYATRVLFLKKLYFETGITVSTFSTIDLFLSRIVVCCFWCLSATKSYDLWGILFSLT